MNFASTTLTIGEMLEAQLNMTTFVRLLFTLILLGGTGSAQAALIQDIYFFFGTPPEDLEPNAGIVRFEFPQEGGCVSGDSFFGDPIDCTDLGRPETNSPEDIVITGDLIGEGEFSAGYWDIGPDWFISGLLAFLSPGDVTTLMNIEGPLFPDDTTPAGRLGEFQAFNPGVGSLFGDVVAVPRHVPEPATVALFGLGLVGLGWSRRKRV